MLATLGNRFNFDVHNATNWALAGSSITPGNNTFPTYAEILSDTVVTQDCYEITIMVSNGASIGAVRDALLNIGADPAGGSTFTTIIPNLQVGCTALTGQGTIYRFPLFIKSGTALAAQASVNNATPGTMRVFVRLNGQPTRPELLRAGSYVTSFGETTASSSGTAVTPGASNAEGAAFVQLGSNLTRDHWWWQVGLGVNNTALGGGAYFVDIAAGSAVGTNDLIITNELYTSNASEWLYKPNWNHGQYYREVPTGVGIYGRCSFSTTADTGVSMMAYGLGG